MSRIGNYGHGKLAPEPIDRSEGDLRETNSKSDQKICHYNAKPDRPSSWLILNRAIRTTNCVRFMYDIASRPYEQNTAARWSVRSQHRNGSYVNCRTRISFDLHVMYPEFRSRSIRTAIPFTSNFPFSASHPPFPSDCVERCRAQDGEQQDLCCVVYLTKLSHHFELFHLPGGGGGSSLPASWRSGRGSPPPGRRCSSGGSGPAQLGGSGNGVVPQRRGQAAGAPSAAGSCSGRHGSRWARAG
jgi:hypothetical protein